MSDPSYEDCLLREWAPLDTLLQQIPLKAHRGLFTHELNLTCIDALLDFIAVGSNLGLVYWYSRRTGNLQTFRFENSTSAITCIKVISTVDYMLAAGNEHGVITVFQIPKDPPHSLPESVKPKRKKQIERYTISGLHSSPVTAIEWSLNGMKLFSGDKNGLVVLTEIDFYMHLSKSVELLNEKYEIVQLSYSQQLLLVSTTYRSILCQRDDRWRVSQVGQKERKVLGRLGATFYQNGEKPKELIVYASRPGLRLWLADKNGVVEQTLIYKDTMIRGHRLVPLINPAPAHLRQERVDHTFGPLLVFKDKLLVTYSHDMVYVLDTCDIFVVATVADLRSVQDISVTKNEIFILEGNRNIVRVACLPECLLVPGQDENMENQHDVSLLSIPVSIANVDVASSLADFSSKIPAISLHKISCLGKSPAVQAGFEDRECCVNIAKADEAIELPPIVAFPEKLANLTVEETDVCKNFVTNVKPEVEKRTSSSYQHSKEVSREELLLKIGEQQFEEVVFKHNFRKKGARIAGQIGKRYQIPDGETGSDTISIDSVQSDLSEGVEFGSSEHLDVNSDCSDMLTKASSNEEPDKHSTSEGTLIHFGDSMIRESGALISEDACSVLESDIPISNCSISISHLPVCIQPDLRSPISIERDVADKERLLAEALNFDALCLDNISEVSEGKCRESSTSFQISSVSTDVMCTTPCLTESCSAQDEDKALEIKETCLQEYQNGKITSACSVLSHDLPSGNCAPSSYNMCLDVGSTLNVFASEKADCWVQHRIPDGIINFAVSCHYVCCVDSNSRLHYSGLNGLSLKWQKTDDRAEHIALSLDAKLVWKLHKGTAYALVQPSLKGPFGEKWIVAAKDVQSIAVGKNEAWYISLDCRVYIQKHLSSDQPCSPSSPVCCVLPAVKVCCFEETVWVLTSTEKVLYRDGVSRDQPEGTQWREVIISFPVMDIALGCQRTSWVIDDKNMIHFTNDFTATTPQWWQLLISDYIFQPTTPLQDLCMKFTDNYLKNLRQSTTIILASSENTMWISEKMADKIHMNKTGFTGHQWNRVQLKNFPSSYRWQQISAQAMSHDEGQLWLLSEAGDFFCYFPASGNFQVIPVPDMSSVTCLSATPEAIWLLTSEGLIYVRQLHTLQLSENCWKKVNLTQLDNVRFVHISSGRDTMWACSDQGDVYMTIGSPRSMASPTFAPAWIPTDEKNECHFVFTKVYVSLHMVWALDKKRSVYVRRQICPDLPLGNGWSLVCGIEAVELALSGSAVWAVSVEGYVYQRYGITQKNYMGDYWKKIPGSVNSLTATLTNELWALDKKHSLLKHRQLQTTLCHEDLNSTPPDTCQSLEGDWEHI